MMFLKREQVIGFVKLFGFLFLSFMFITALVQMNQMTYEKEVKHFQSFPLSKVEIAPSDSKNNNCSKKPYSFFIYAFILGAFWNVKKIQKLGSL